MPRNYDGPFDSENRKNELNFFLSQSRLGEGAKYEYKLLNGIRIASPDSLIIIQNFVLDIH